MKSLVNQNKSHSREYNEISIVGLPLPPSLWQAYVGFGRNRKTSEKYELCIWQIRRVLKEQNIFIPKALCYRFDIYMYSSDWLTKKKTVKRKDIDNYIKCLTDPITKYFTTFDDCQIWTLNCYKIISEENYCDVTIMPMSEFPNFLKS